MVSYLITGAAGFIGCNFIRFLLSCEPDATIIAVDNLSFAANLANLDQLPQWQKSLIFYPADICDYTFMSHIYQLHRPDYVINFAAESHNDRAIISPSSFMRANALGAQILLECSRNHPVAKHVHISTIEVYGELGIREEYFSEASPLNAKTPYSATKAAGDQIVRAYMLTYPTMRISLTHCANNYGPYQLPEKLIPLAITQLLCGKKVPIYGDGLQKRDWLHVADHCAAIYAIAHYKQGSIPADAATRPELLPIYDISAEFELTNIDLVMGICSNLGITSDNISEWVDYVSDRPNHDRRYRINPQKITTELGWKPAIDFRSGLADTITWYQDNAQWWENILAAKKLITHWGNN